jgi:hypothetical protein
MTEKTKARLKDAWVVSFTIGSLVSLVYLLVLGALCLLRGHTFK